MEHLIIPKDYHSELNLHDTQIAIKTVKDFFQNLLALRLNLSRVSAPLFVDPLSGLNDNLNGIERPVTFDIKEQNGKEAEVVQSLAKWKRYALKKYGFDYGEGLHRNVNCLSAIGSPRSLNGNSLFTIRISAAFNCSNSSGETTRSIPPAS